MEYICVICAKTEALCECDKFCILCKSDEDVRLCIDGCYYCGICREVCDFTTQ